MKFLIDTNVVIPLEPTELGDLVPNTAQALEFHRLAANTGNEVLVHPDIHCDLDRDRNEQRAQVRRAALGRYNVLRPPERTVALPPEAVGQPERGTNDWVDNRLLEAVAADTADFLVTEDTGIHRKANRLGISSRVLLLADAVGTLRDLFDKAPLPPPSVEERFVYDLDANDPIFGTLREDYEGFDEWLAKCRKEHRKAYVVRRTENGEIAALCIIKPEEDNPFGLTGKVLKLCTFKVCPHETGNRYGELLLKTVFDFIYENGYDRAYFTAFPHRADIAQFAQEFGFLPLGVDTPSGECVLVKEVVPPADNDLSALDLHIRYGPRITRFDGNRTFIVPIRPEYHYMLFPENEVQRQFPLDIRPCGNSLKKAYLSNASITKLGVGNNILFYRSGDMSAVTAVGIVEDTLRSTDAEELARYVGRRTVYTFEEIKAMANKSVLALKFRLVRLLPESIPLNELVANGVLKGAPQSISELKGGGIEWLQSRLDV